MLNSNRLIVGLGNPGTDYEATRHNIGFMAVDAIAERYNCGAWREKFKGAATVSTSPPFFLLKPKTFMNESGMSVVEAMQFYKLTPKNLIVFHDDLDLLPGQVRIKKGGGHGGHNGLRSIDAHIGKDYWRVRLGIGRPGAGGDLSAESLAKKHIVTSYVLGNFARADQAWLPTLLETVADEFNVMLEGNPTDYAKRITEKMNTLG